MNRCAICRTKVRKTTTVYVRSDGALVRARVCNSCAKDTVRMHVGGAAARCSCGELASCCGSCADKRGNKDRKATLKAAAKKLRLLAKGYYAAESNEGDRWTQARIDGLKQAADIVEAGAF